MSKPTLVSIVVDDEIVRAALEALVQSFGYLTRAFGSAEEFLTSRFVAGTACVVSDMRMPGMTGAQLQSELIASGHRLPIIFITGDPVDRLRGPLIAAGAVDVLSKPFDKCKLLASLQRALSGS